MTTNWRPISELPELEADGFSKPVLLFMEDYSAVGFWTQRGHWMVRGMKIVEPTHWCEITPPAEPVPQDMEFIATAVDYRDCLELAGNLAECIEKADGSWCYEGDDLPGQFVHVLLPVMQDLADFRRDGERWRKLAPLLSFKVGGYTSASGSLMDATRSEWRLRTDHVFATSNGDAPGSIGAAVDALPDPAT